MTVRQMTRMISRFCSFENVLESSEKSSMSEIEEDLEAIDEKDETELEASPKLKTRSSKDHAHVCLMSTAGRVIF